MYVCNLKIKMGEVNDKKVVESEDKQTKEEEKDKQTKEEEKDKQTKEEEKDKHNNQKEKDKICDSKKTEEQKEDKGGKAGKDEKDAPVRRFSKGGTELKKPTLGGYAIKPPGWDRTGYEKFRYSVYDPSTGAIFTRTPMSWLKIILFYTVFFSTLAGFWAACLHVFFLTIPLDQPRWLLNESIIGTNPGVGVRPRPSDKRISSSLYMLNMTEEIDSAATDAMGEGELNADYAKRIELMLDQYKNTQGIHNCTENKEMRGHCVFDISVLGPCSVPPYGYRKDGQTGRISPCVYLKLNKIFGLVPPPLDLGETSLTNTTEMSDQLRQIVQAEQDQGGADSIYMDCKGRFAADREIVSFTYYPANRAIPTSYFPYNGSKNYQSPLVAVQVDSARLGQMVHLECRAWYEGVLHDTNDRMGLVQFEILIQ